LALGSKKLDSLPVEEQVLQTDPDAMDVDENEELPEQLAKDYGIDVNFEDLDDDLKNVSLAAIYSERY
jgi:structural maintenance of chromosome 1